MHFIVYVRGKTASKFFGCNLRAFVVDNCKTHGEAIASILPGFVHQLQAQVDGVWSQDGEILVVNVEKFMLTKLDV